jgi:hypothetical protein
MIYKLTIANVHRYFKAETHFCSCWFCPHNLHLLLFLPTTLCRWYEPIMHLRESEHMLPIMIG